MSPTSEAAPRRTETAPTTRPSGTEDIYKFYAESFSGADHLQRILKEAPAIVDRAIESPFHGRPH